MIAMDETMPPHRTSRQGQAKIPTWGRNRWRTELQFDLVRIGVARLTPSSQARCATRLRHSYSLTRPDCWPPPGLRLSSVGATPKQYGPRR